MLANIPSPISLASKGAIASIGTVCAAKTRGINEAWAKGESANAEEKR